MNAKEAQTMLDTATKNKKKLVIGFQYRFGSNSTFLRNAYDSGTLGKVM